MLSPVHLPACPQLMSAATGMLYLHNRPAGAIVHRDLKSPNLLVDQGWNCKVGVGTARWVGMRGGKHYGVSPVASTRGAWPMHGQLAWAGAARHRRTLLISKTDHSPLMPLPSLQVTVSCTADEGAASSAAVGVAAAIEAGSN